MKLLDEVIEATGLLIVGLILVLALGLSGCAGHQALIWRQPKPYVEECPIRVCEKLNPRDKTCWREYCTR